MSANRSGNGRVGVVVAVGLLVVAGVLFYSFGRKAAPPGPVETPAGPAAAETPLALGQRLFDASCAGCHGETGGGDGPAARFLYPKPRNFREGRFRVVTTANLQPSDDDLLQVIDHGMPGSAMFSFGHLPEGERRALAGYVRHLARTGLVDRGKQQDPTAEVAELGREADEMLRPGEALVLPAGLPVSGPESVARGQKLYREKACAGCHGGTGKGDGAQDQRDELGVPIRPRDFGRGIFKGGSDARQLFARIRLGMPGTPMPGSTDLSDADVGDLINFTLSLSDTPTRERAEHRRRQLVAKKVGGPLAEDVPENVWASAGAQSILVTPLWWRNHDDLDLRVAAVHDGQTVAVRLTWRDASRNDAATRTEDFEDMAAVQLAKGPPEPFLGMGATGAGTDVWLWRAGWTRPKSPADHPLDDYPFQGPPYDGLIKGGEKGLPDFLTARAAGNPHAHTDPAASASSLGAKGPGSITFLPVVSQRVTARAAWKDGRRTVVLRRPLAVGVDAGLPLAAGGKYSIAFAVWDGEARDRNGQKFVSVWHDLKIEE